MKLRTILIAVLAVVVVLVVAVVILMGKVDNYRPGIQAELQKQLNRPVTLGHLSLKLIPLEIQVDGFSIGEAANFPQDRPFATASTVFVSASLFSLLRGSPEVKNIALDKPQIELIRNAAGVWNFSSLGKSSSSAGESNFSLNALDINDGQVGYTDQLNKEPRSVYDHIDLRLTDFAPGKQFGVNLGVHFPGQGQQILEFAGKVGPLNVATENALPPVSGHVSIKQVSIAGVNQFASGTIPTDTNAVVSGEADVNSLADVLACKGNLSMENTVLHGAKMNYSIHSTYNLEDDFKQKKLLIRSGDVQLGPTSFMASGDVNTATTPATLNVELKTDHSSITELAKLAGGLGVGFNPAYNVAGKVTADVTAKGLANAPQLTGSIRAEGLQASGGEIKQPVSIPEIDLNLSPDSVSSNTFTASSGSTALTIAFTLLQYATVNRSIDATVKTNGANVAELLNIAKTYGVTATEGMTGTGQLSLNVRVKGPLANASALSYAGTANVSNLVVNTPELKKPLSIASANANFSQNSVALDNLAATLGSTTVHGSLSAKNFAAPQVAFNLNADKIDTAELENITNTPSSNTAAKGKTETPSLLLSTTGGGTLAAGEIKANDIVLKNVSTKCQLDKGVISLSPLSTEIFGGKASGSLSLDERPKVAECAVKVKFAGVDANSLLSSVSSVKDMIYGSLAADTNIKFMLTQANELAHTLNGAISFNLTNGQIKNLNLMNEVEKVGKLMKGGGTETAGGATALKKFTGTLTIVNGLATTDNLTGETNEATITSKGTLNLVSQELNMHVTAALGGGATAQQTGGGGLLGTVLSNGKGGLVVPVIVTGNMAHPIVTPDAAEFAKLKLSNLGGAKSAVGGVLNGILGGTPADGKTKKPANPLGSILDQFNKKKQ
jgi:uncharacterized protein involved in outer membrane biogenesis